MEISIFLAKFIGIYLIIEGLLALLMHKEIIPIISEIKNKAGFLLLGNIITIIGLLIVISHNIWVSYHQFFISLIGWIILIKGLLIIFLPPNTTKEMIAFFNKPIFYNINGIISISIGLWLTYFGFIV